MRAVVAHRDRLLREGLQRSLAAAEGLTVLRAEDADARDAEVVLIAPGDVAAAEAWPGARIVQVGDDWEALLAALRAERGAEPPPAPVLTPRELAVIRAFAEGASTRDVADALGIATKTVESHKQRLFTKLGVQQTAAAVAWCAAAGLLDPARS
jgi:DNA-binding CsgD family transcriptional regulator